MRATSSRQFFAWAAALALALLTACGGSDAPAPPPQQQSAPPAGMVVGPAGGIVTGPGSAQVVIPAGALVADTTIDVAQSAAGAPAMPGSFEAFGQTFAFTPHGQTFAVPVTVTVPFDASAVPAGRTPAMYKTNAAGQWERVDNAIVNAGTVSAQVTSFSWLAIGNVPPVITQQPQDQTVVEGSVATFTTVGFGAPPLTFQWQVSDDGGVTFSDVVGANADSLTIDPASVAQHNGRRFRLLVVSPEGTALSNAALLTVSSSVIAPSITGHPQNQSAAVGATATFNCSASGTNVAYQWQSSTDGGATFGDITGATSASYTTPAAQTGDDGQQFRCRASNSAGSVTSNAATLTVCGSVTLSGTGAALLSGSCFNPTSSQTSSSTTFTSIIWESSNLRIEALHDLATPLVMRTIIATRVGAVPPVSWSAVNFAGIAGVSRVGNSISLSNVALPQDPTAGNPGGGATTLILNGALTAP